MSSAETGGTVVSAVGWRPTEAAVEPLQPLGDNPEVNGSEQPQLMLGGEVRMTTAADLDAVTDLAISRAGGERAQWTKRLTEDLVDHERGLWVADRGGVVIGYGRVHRFQAAPDAPPLIAPDGFYLIGLAISVGNRRQGLGRAITRARLQWIAERATEAWFFTNARNEISLRLHAQLGFHEVTRDFVFPGVDFEGGVGVLCTVEL
jgi:RimJ/RimL family protein N-acetyltransferase